MAGILKVDRVQSDSNLSFQVAGANVAYMNASGLSMTGGTLSLGGTTIIPGVGQIAFPANQNASANANTLDDYEEGTWSPTILGDSTSGQSYTWQTGVYTKVGNLVVAQYDVYLSVKGTTTGTYARIGGLPFNNNTAALGTGSIGYYYNLTSNWVWLTTYIDGNGNFAYITGQQAASATISYVNAAAIQNSVRIAGTLVYCAA